MKALICGMGNKVEEIFDRFGLLETEVKTYDTVTKNFQEHFIKQHNPIKLNTSSNSITQCNKQWDLTSGCNNEERALIHLLQPLVPLCSIAKTALYKNK